MKTVNSNRTFVAQMKLSLVCLLVLNLDAKAENLIVILDNYAYQPSSDLTLDLSHKIFSMNSNMIDCHRLWGGPPLDTNDYALHTNSQFIGLDQFKFNVPQNIVVLKSETGDLICTNGIFVDPIFQSGFE